MVLSKLGIQTVPMLSSTLTFGRVTSDATTAWKAEGQPFSNSSVGIDGVTLTAKTIICGVNLSHELANDAPNAGMLVESTIARAIAGAVDKAGLVGSGTVPEPQGIFGYTGVTDTGTIGTPSYDDFSDLYYRINEANENPNGLVLASRTLKTLDQIKGYPEPIFRATAVLV